MPPQRPPRPGNHSPRDPKARANFKPKSASPSSRRNGTGPARPASQTARRPSPPASPTASRPADLTSGPERLQKILAHAGVGSRRACEELILQGRVTAGGQVIRELGTRVDPARTPVAVDGQRVQLEKPVYFAVYKPKGYVSTNDDPSGRPRVLDILPEIPQRVYTVGRLDEMSVGLMLLTNDGELANKLAHPRYGVEKLYRVVVAGSPAREVLNQLVEGIWLAEGKVRAKSVRAVGKRGESTILELVLAEGKNREVRRMLAKLGHKVMTLTRVAVGPITIKGLTAGQYRPLTGREVDLLRRVAAGQSVPMPWMTDRRPRREPERPRRAEGSSRPPAPAPGGHRPGPRGRSGPSGGPPRRDDGPRTAPPGAYRPANGPGLPQHPGVRPSERPPAGRRPGPPAGHAPGRRDRDEGPPRSNGPRSYRDEGPRHANGPGNDGRDRREQGAGPPRPGGPRPYRQEGQRPSNRPLDERRPGPRPGGAPGPSAGRRPGPPQGEEMPRRRVIGLEGRPPEPPAPEAVVGPGPGRGDRPKPRMKRPPGKKPAPRTSAGSRPMPKPKPRKGGRGGPK